jgi:hypothetical protein
MTVKLSADRRVEIMVVPPRLKIVEITAMRGTAPRAQRSPLSSGFGERACMRQTAYYVRVAGEHCFAGGIFG